MAIFGIGITILAAVLTYQAWKNGKWMKDSVNCISSAVNSMSSAVNNMRDLLKEIHEQGELRHREVMETLKQQHQDVVNLLKKGFGA